MIDFHLLTEYLKPKIKKILIELLPGGKFKGAEYMCANFLGGIGDSFRYNIEKFTGSDFATGETYGNILNLYSKLKNVSLPLAAQELAIKYGYDQEREIFHTKPQELKPLPPKTEFYHFRHGNPSHVWTYSETFKIARYETNSGKQFCPWTRENVESPWEHKAPPAPRPLYNMEEIKSRPEAPILIVEGEKCADAAKLFAPDHVVTTWSNGAAAVRSADWMLLSGRNVIIWPDNDLPGLKAAEQISQILSAICPSIQIIDVSGQLDKWDAADSGFTPDQFREWLSTRVKRFSVFQPASNVEVKSTPIIEPAQPTLNPGLTAFQINVKIGENDVLTGTQKEMAEKLHMATVDGGNPICNTSNVLRVLEGWPEFKNTFWFDDFYHEVFYRPVSPTATNETKIWSDVDGINLMIFIQRYLGMTRITESMVRQAVLAHAHNTRRNEPQDYLNSLSWDGVDRIDKFFHTAAGSTDNEYTTAISRNFWLSLVARILSPGCKVDTMVILEGQQGTRKSSLLEIIGGKWHSSIVNSINSVDFYQCLKGKIIIEFADLSGFPRDDRNRIKHMLASRVDTYRKSYGHSPGDYPRRSIFCATTNDEVYLQDETGARRFWPLKTSSISLDYAREYRDQLFAEAMQIFNSGLPHLDERRPDNTKWWRVPESASEEQEDRREIHPWEAAIMEFVRHKDVVTMQEIFAPSGPIPIEISKRNKFDDMRAGVILKMAGFQRTRRRVNGVRNYIYHRNNTLDFLPDYGKNEPVENSVSDINLVGTEKSGRDNLSAPWTD